MSVKIEKSSVYMLKIKGRELGKFTRDELDEIRCSIDKLFLEESQQCDWKNIVNQVCATCQLSHEDLFSNRRPEHIAFSRQIAMSLIYERTSLSLHEVGKLFGRDHGTVMHARHVINARRRCATQGKVIRSIEAALAHQAKTESLSSSNGGNPPEHANGHGEPLAGHPTTAGVQAV